jgi:hemerythrin-like domain-containing protein
MSTASAFSVIPEPPPGAEDPLQAMAGRNQRLLGHCASLRRLVLYLAECGFDSAARQVLPQLLEFFDYVWPSHQADAEEALFPALIESMAGSDAVCLHEITGGLASEHRELRRLWRGLRPALQAVAAGRAESLPAQDVEAFVERCRACVAREDGELLPMAQRLLSDEQLQLLSAAMRQRRPGTT